MPSGSQASQTSPAGQRRSLFQTARDYPRATAGAIGLATAGGFILFGTRGANFGTAAQRFANMRSLFRDMPMRRVVTDATTPGAQQYAPRVDAFGVTLPQARSFPTLGDRDLLSALRRRGMATPNAHVDIVHVMGSEGYVNGMATGFHVPQVDLTRVLLVMPDAHLETREENRALAAYVNHHELTHVAENHLTVDAVTSGVTHGAAVYAALTLMPSFLPTLGVYAGGMFLRSLVQGAVSRQLEIRADRGAYPHLSDESLAAGRDLHLAPREESTRSRVPSYGEMMHPGFFNNPLVRGFGAWYSQATETHPDGETRAQDMQDELDRRAEQRSNP